MKVWCVFEKRYDGNLDLRVIFSSEESAENYKANFN